MAGERELLAAPRAALLRSLSFNHWVPPSWPACGLPETAGRRCPPCTGLRRTRTHLRPRDSSAKAAALRQRMPMAYDEQLATRIREAFRTRHHISERKMFGGLAFLYRGRMCCGIVGSDLMVRVPDDEFDAVVDGPHARPMDFTGRPLRGFVYVSPPGFRTAAALRTWLTRGLRAADERAAGPAKRRARRATVAGARRRRPNR